MFCGNCGAQLTEKDIFCPACGSKVNETGKNADRHSERHISTTEKKKVKKSKTFWKLMFLIVLVFVVSIGGLWFRVQKKQESAYLAYVPISDIISEENISNESNDDKTVLVNFELNSDLVDGVSIQSATVTGLNKQDEVVWTYKSQDYEEAQLDRVSEIGMNGDTYYFVEDGAIVALDVSDGSVLWKNEAFSGACTAFSFGEDGTLYLCGYFGPDFFAVDKSGETLCKIKSFDSQYYCPYKMEYEDDQIVVTFEGSTLENGDGNSCVVNLKDYTYSFLEDATAADIKDDDIGAYRDVLDMFYYKISGGWNKTEDVSYLFYWGYSPIQSLADAGYALMDLDKNGVPELLVTSVTDAADGLIYDLYTCVNDKVVHLATSGERYRYYLCDDNTIYLESSGGAENSSYEIYEVEPGKDLLKLKELVVYDGYKDQNNPWFYGQEIFYDEMNGYDTDKMTKITEEEALNIIHGYETASIQLNSFEQYSVR